ncbi:aldolase [Gammaproteobacteria bacterium AS21]|jgi:L-fuculose-phosphate aldolase
MTIRDKEYFDNRSTQEMALHLRKRELSVTQKLAVTARMLSLDGHEAGLAGQITARAEQEGTYWTLRFGVGFDEARAEDFIKIDDDLNTIEGEGMANPATRFHTWVYRNRLDISSIVHTHPPFISAMSMLEEPLVIAHMDQTPFYNDCAFLKEWPGVPIADDEGRIITQALEGKHAIILAHHGYLVAGKTVAESCYLAVYLERAARMQLRAAAVGTIKKVPDDLAEEAGRYLRKKSIIDATFDYFTRQTERVYGSYLSE